MLEFPDKDFKATMVKIFQQALLNMAWNWNIERFSKEIENIKKHQMEIL